MDPLALLTALEESLEKESGDPALLATLSTRLKALQARLGLSSPDDGLASEANPSSSGEANESQIHDAPGAEESKERMKPQLVIPEIGVGDGSGANNIVVVATPPAPTTPTIT